MAQITPKGSEAAAETQQKQHLSPIMMGFKFNRNRDLPGMKSSLKSTQPSKEMEKASYRWQSGQHSKYVRFLVERRDLFEMPLQKKITLGIHKLMSRYLKNRSARQCRSHHQKMMLKYKTIDNIVLAHQHSLPVNSEVEMTEASGEVREEVEEVKKRDNSMLENLIDMQPYLQPPHQHHPAQELQQIQSYHGDDRVDFDFP